MVARTDEQVKEWLKCHRSCGYFIDTYCWIFDAIAGDWIEFKLWPDQKKALKKILNNRLIVILKARQIGMTWLVLGYALWLMLFRPAATVLLFSKRDDEAIELLDKRLKGMYKRLPEWMHAEEVLADNKHEWELSTGSSAKAFPTTGGDSYTASLVVGDEFDLLRNQDDMLRSVKPTIDNGGQMILLSRPDKAKPQSLFKNIYRAAAEGLNDWEGIFLPWSAHPERDEAWYDRQKQDISSRTGSLDDLHEQYPATATEALAPRTMDKRIAPAWLERVYREMPPLWVVGPDDEDAPAEIPSIVGLRIYRLPQPGTKYVIGGDPAEGNPTSDDSAFTVLDRITGEEVAALWGKFQPSVLASYMDKVGRFYNNADLLPERNNHGHAVINWLADNSRLKVLNGHDRKPGWMSSTTGKSLLYDAAADTVRLQDCTVYTFRTMMQLQSIEGATLKAPEGEMDDLADSYALANIARAIEPPKLTSASVDWYAQTPVKEIAEPGRSATEVEDMLEDYEQHL